jgi:hypothetical protein
LAIVETLDVDPVVDNGRCEIRYPTFATGDPTRTDVNATETLNPSIRLNIFIVEQPSLLERRWVATCFTEGIAQRPTLIHGFERI